MEVIKEATGSKKGAGIKHSHFTSTGNNGESHRKNSSRKRAKHIKNVVARAAVNMERGRISASEYHTRIDNLSRGLAT